MRGHGPGSKELLQLQGRSVLEWVIEEAVSTGCRPVVVTAPHKPDLNEALAALPVETVLQSEPRGLAEAVVLGARLQPALVLLPDTVFHTVSPAPRLVKAVSRGYDFAVAVEQVAEERMGAYGIVEWDGETGRIHRILEKPSVEDTPSRWAVAARFAISPRTLDFLKSRIPSGPIAGEVQLTPLLSQAVAEGHTGIAVPLSVDERRFDCGSPEGLRRAREVFDAEV
jgi:UTP-glucose-1-phosphate uridylyltransferase